MQFILYHFDKRINCDSSDISSDAKVVQYRFPLHRVKTFNAIAVENTSPIFRTLHILQQKQCW